MLGLCFARKLVLRSFSHFIPLVINAFPPPLSQLSQFLTLLPSLPSPQEGGCLVRNNGFQPVFYFEKISSIKKSWKDSMINTCMSRTSVQPLVSVLPHLHFTFPMYVCLWIYTHRHIFLLYHLKVKGHHTVKHKPLNISPYILFQKAFLLHNCNTVATHKFNIKSVIPSSMQSTLKCPHGFGMFLISGSFLPGSSQGLCLSLACHASVLSLNLNSLPAFFGFFIHDTDIFEESKQLS